MKIGDRVVVKRTGASGRIVRIGKDGKPTVCFDDGLFNSVFSVDEVEKV